MHYLRQITNKIFQVEQQKLNSTQSKMHSNSFELIVSDILEEGPSEDFIVLADENE